MAVTTQAQEYKRLRSYLNPYFRGVNTSAVLNALATSSAYLVNNAAAVQDQLFIPTASGVYLDALLSAYDIIRPSNVGLSDTIFSQIGIKVKNRKQVRDLINDILDLMFSDQFTKATDNSTAYEPYNLADGDTLIINFDQTTPVTITFSANQFEDISAALAVEVADAITETLSSLRYTGTAISNNSGNGNYVQLISGTIGPASSVTVLGGSAQNQLLFPSIVSAGGTPATQWTVSSQAGGLIRFTWTGGPNPLVGAITVGNYVNIYGGGFSAYPMIEGTYTVTNVVGGAQDIAYFEVQNILATIATPLVITQGGTTQNPSMLFFNPVTKTLQSLPSYAALYQVQSGAFQLFLPATTSIVNRTRVGASYLPDYPREIFTFIANPDPGDKFYITSTVTLVAGSNFAIGATYQITMANLAAAVNAIPGLVAIVGESVPSVESKVTFPENLTATVISYNLVTFSTPAVYPIQIGDILTIYGINALVSEVFSQSAVKVHFPGFPIAFNPNFATPDIPALLTHKAYDIITIYQTNPSFTLVGTYVQANSLTPALLIGLISYWPFDGNENDVKDGNTLDILSSPPPSFTEGINGQAISFNSEQYAAVANNPSLQPSGSFSFSGWVNIPSTFTGNMISKLYDGTDYSFSMQIEADGINWIISTTGTNEFDAVVVSGPLTPNTWYMITAVYNNVSKTASIYINNNAPVTVTANGPVYPNTADLVFGNNNAFLEDQLFVPEYGPLNWYNNLLWPLPEYEVENNFVTLMSQWGYWDRVLTSSDVTALYNSGNGLVYNEATTGISGSGPLGDAIALQLNQPGPYIYDTTQPFSVSAIETTLTQNLNGADPRIFTVVNSSLFPDAPGFLVIDYGDDSQEFVPYVGRPSDTTLLISPTYTLQKVHLIGANVFLAYNGSVMLTSTGSDYPFYITDVVAGRVYAQSLISSVAAAGILINTTILYPSAIGLGGFLNPLANEISIIYGEDQ
jgi:hypothetical protein